MSDFVTPWTAACQTSLAINNGWILLKLISIESIIQSNHLIFVIPFSSRLQYFSSIRVFCSESFLHIRWPNNEVSPSASVFPMNIQDWFPLGWTCWIFSNTTVYIDPVIQYILILCIKYITNENLLYSTGNSTQSSVMT